MLRPSSDRLVGVSAERLAEQWLDRHWVPVSSSAVGAGEASDKWLAALGAFLQDGTLETSRDSKAIGPGAALYFVYSLSHPNRSWTQCRIRPTSPWGA